MRRSHCACITTATENVSNHNFSHTDTHTQTHTLNPIREKPLVFLTFSSEDLALTHPVYTTVNKIYWHWQVEPIVWFYFWNFKFTLHIYDLTFLWLTATYIGIQSVDFMTNLLIVQYIDNIEQSGNTEQCLNDTISQCPRFSKSLQNNLFLSKQQSQTKDTKLKFIQMIKSIKSSLMRCWTRE